MREVCILLLLNGVCVCVKVAQSCPALCDRWTAQSMEFGMFYISLLNYIRPIGLMANVSLLIFCLDDHPLMKIIYC